jgi:hypothetical protein
MSDVTPGREIPKGYNVEPRQYDPACPPATSKSDTTAGTNTLTNLAEHDALCNMVMSVPIVYAENKQSIDGQEGKERI